MFVARHPEIALSEDKLVLSGPSYKYLSTASHGIVHHFAVALNLFRVRHDLEPVQQLHMIRSTVGTDAYAMGDAAVRATHLAKSSYHIDAGMVNDGHFIFIDDVNVTGATEARTLDRINVLMPKSMTCLHVAEIDPDYAVDNAAIENVMNKTVEFSLENVLRLAQQRNFRLNTRTFRSIMEWSDQEKLADFLLAVDDVLLLEMGAAIVGGTKEMFSRFPSATMLLLDVLSRRELLPQVIA